MISHYLAVALRSFRRSPVTASVNVLALALGLAAFIAAYGVVSYWRHAERHFANVDRTFVVTAALGARDGKVATLGPQTNRLFAEHLRVDFPEFDAIARTQVMNQEGGVAAGDVRTRMYILGAEAEFLDIFDLPFVAGDPKNALGQPNSAVLTQDAATRLFGETNPLGKTLTLGSVLDVTVTGVIGPIPEPSHLGHSASATQRFDILTSWDTLDGLQAASRARAAARTGAGPAPAQMPPGQQASQSNQSAPAGQPSAAQSGQSGQAPPAGQSASSAQSTSAARPANTPPPPENWLGGYCCTTYVMLKKDSKLTLRELNAQLKAFGDRHLPIQQKELASLVVGAVPVSGLIVAQLDGQLLSGAPLSITMLLMALGTLVLVVACVNYANLATAQAARRAREVGLRKAIGAGKYRIMAQYLTEAALLAVTALGLAMVVIRLATPTLHDAVGIDLRLGLADNVRFWALLAALLLGVTLLGGAYPAFVLSRVPPVEALRIGRSRVGPRFAGTLLVGVQFTAASFLLIVVLVMQAQNRELERTGLGSTRDPLVVTQNAPAFSGIDSTLLMSELARVPQVTGVAEIGDSPWSANINLVGVARTPDEANSMVLTYINTVGYDYFAVLDVPVLGGRAFDREHGDDLAPQNLFDSSRAVSAVADESLVKQLGFSTTRDAVDQMVYFPEKMTRAFGAPAQPVRIIGVVADKPLHFRGAGSTANLYLLRTGLNVQLVRLKATDVSGGLAALDALWRRIGPQTSSNRKFMDDLFNQNYENFARISAVFVGLSFLAVVISVTGLFGMAIQVASRRVHEIGVRKSVGARTDQIVTMLLTHFSKPVLVANLLAWPLAYFAAQQYLGIFIHRISLTPIPFVLSLGVALAIAWASVGSQALRAARVSPANVLRAD
jgi:putative ABC transport system permease protein